MNSAGLPIRVRGAVGLLKGRYLHGWVYAQDQPNTSLTIDILVDGTKVTSQVADEYRKDLEKAGIGDGRHAFAVEIPTEFFDDHAHTIAVKEATSGVFLGTLENIVLDRREISPFHCAVLGLRGAYLVGFAYHCLDATPLSIVLLVNGHEVGRAVANQAARLIAAADMPPNSGFAFPVGLLDPNELVGAKVEIAVVPTNETIATYNRFAQDFAWLDLQKNGSTLTPSVNLAFVPAKKIPVNVFAGGDLYATVDCDPLSGRTCFPIPILISESHISSFAASARYSGSGIEIGNSPLTAQIRRNLLSNPRFETWKGAVPDNWHVATPEGVRVTKSYGPATSEGALVDHKLVLDGADGGTLSGAQISQTVEIDPEAAGPIDVFLEARTDQKSSAVLFLASVADDGSQCEAQERVALCPDWTLAGARFELLPAFAARPITIGLKIESSDVKLLEMSLFAAGFPGFTVEARQRVETKLPSHSGEPANAICGTFEQWTGPLKQLVRERFTRLADNWVLSLKDRQKSVVEAKLTQVDTVARQTGAAVQAYGLALMGPIEGKYARLGTELNKFVVAQVGPEMLSFWAQKASSLSPSAGEDRSDVRAIGEIFVVERDLDGVDTKIVSLGKGFPLSTVGKSFDLRLSLDQSTALKNAASRILYDLQKSLVLIFEFSGFVDCVLTQVSLSAARDEALRAQPTGYVAIEDANIVAQVPLIKGLEKWCDPERLNPVQPAGNRYFNGAVAAWDWPVVPRSVDIVICVHDAIEETLACLDSVRQFTQMPHTVTIVDDASSEFTREQLRRYCAGLPWIRHVQLKQNMGYTKAANVGLKQSKADWLVLLNSDTVVSPGWLEGLFDVVSAKPDVALVGPLSNAASWQSVPDLKDVNGSWKVNALPDGMSVAEMAELVRRLSRRDFPEAPLLNGFCTLMRRSVLEEVEFLDEVAFPVGYGEENDLCIRVAQAGYKLAIADHVYVYHVKSATFGTKGRNQLSKKGTASFVSKHPNIDLNELQQRLAGAPPLIELRKALRQHLHGASPVSSTIW